MRADHQAQAYLLVEAIGAEHADDQDRHAGQDQVVRQIEDVCRGFEHTRHFRYLHNGLQQLQKTNQEACQACRALQISNLV
ncbi:hypothetical protein D3C81_1935070 [compost metagenome]